MPKRALPAFLLVAPLLLAPASPANAQGMPSEIEQKLAELGAVINPPETAKLYTALQETEPYQGIKVTRDLKYGSDERHALDVFAPEPPSTAPRAVLIYVHGASARPAARSSTTSCCSPRAAASLVSTSPTDWRRNTSGRRARRMSPPRCAG